MNTKNKKLDHGYRAMAADTQYEAGAMEWINGLQSSKVDQIVTSDELRLTADLDWSKAKVVTFPNLKRTIRTI